MDLKLVQNLVEHDNGKKEVEIINFHLFYNYLYKLSKNELLKTCTTCATFPPLLERTVVSVFPHLSSYPKKAFSRIQEYRADYLLLPELIF
jgi:hypothetical protein